MLARYGNILSRCYDEGDRSYPNYGGRGIGVYSKWREDFWLFYAYVVSLDGYGTPKYTLDRINNNGGYEPGNLRWCSRSIQRVNQREPRKNKTGYVGIRIMPNGKFCVRVKYEGKRVRVGTFKTIEEAVKRRNKHIIDNRLPHSLQYPMRGI